MNFGRYDHELVSTAVHSYVSENPGATISSVSDATGVTYSRVCTAMRELEAEGLVVRESAIPSRWMIPQHRDTCFTVSVTGVEAVLLKRIAESVGKDPAELMDGWVHDCIRFLREVLE